MGSLALDPRGYHLVSLLWHVSNAVVLYGLTMALLARAQPEFRHQNPWTCALAAGLATALFAVHPLRVEAVAWVSCQSYLPCALFAMLSVLAYLKAFATGPAPRWGWLAGSFVLFGASLLSKAPAVSLPAVLLILDVYPLRRLSGGPGRWFGASARRVWWEKVPFVALSLLFMGLAIAARGDVQTLIPLEHQGAAARIAQACYGTWFYLVKTVFPLGLTAFYPLHGRLDWFAPWFLASILGTVAMSVGLFLMRRRWPGTLAAWLSYLVMLAPGSGVILIGNRLAADRYSYLSMMGGVILTAGGLCRLGPTFWRTRAGVIGTIAVSLGSLGVLGFLTWHQCRTCATREPYGLMLWPMVPAEVSKPTTIWQWPCRIRGSLRRPWLITARRSESSRIMSRPTTTWECFWRGRGRPWRRWLDTRRRSGSIPTTPRPITTWECS